MPFQKRSFTGSELSRSTLVAYPLLLALGALILLVWSGGDSSGLPKPEAAVGGGADDRVITFGPWRDTLETVVSPETADALEKDRQLRRSFGAAVDFTRT